MAQFASWLDFTVTRIVVFVSALILFCLGIASISAGEGVVHFLLNLVVILLACFGMIGALIIQLFFLQLYLLMLSVLIALELLFIVISACIDTYYEGNHQRLGYDITVLILLALAAIFTFHFIDDFIYQQPEISRFVWFNKTNSKHPITTKRKVKRASAPSQQTLIGPPLSSITASTTSTATAASAAHPAPAQQVHSVTADYPMKGTEQSNSSPNVPSAHDQPSVPTEQVHPQSLHIDIPEENSQIH